MRIESLYPKPPEGIYATPVEAALAATIREQRDTIDDLVAECDRYKEGRRGLADRITRLESILCAVTATACWQARMYSDDLRALPVGTVVRDEGDLAWTRVDDEDGGAWATPTVDETFSSADLAAGTTLYLGWVTGK